MRTSRRSSAAKTHDTRRYQQRITGREWIQFLDGYRVRIILSSRNIRNENIKSPMNRAPATPTFSNRDTVNHVTDQFAQLTSKDNVTQDFSAEQQFREVQTGLKKRTLPFCGALPQLTTPKEHRNPGFRMIPTSTRTATTHTDFARSVEAQGPMYLRQWPSWDSVPFLPSRGDVSLDPRYGMETKGSTTTYVRLNT